MLPLYGRVGAEAALLTPAAAHTTPAARSSKAQGPETHEPTAICTCQILPRRMLQRRRETRKGTHWHEEQDGWDISSEMRSNPHSGAGEVARVNRDAAYGGAMDRN